MSKSSVLQSKSFKLLKVCCDSAYFGEQWSAVSPARRGHWGHRERPMGKFLRLMTFAFAVEVFLVTWLSGVGAVVGGSGRGDGDKQVNTWSEVSGAERLHADASWGKQLDFALTSCLRWLLGKISDVSYTLPMKRLLPSRPAITHHCALPPSPYVTFVTFEIKLCRRLGFVSKWTLHWIVV